ncbi:hypothetical protein BD410DRAFT_843823 [Rickenella mellea]|uniref:Uncharacterized protein n=1 Tax=Rickenella mellea TaxID=50990 RepID=A0A4Y7PP39_9AGAM|nr:hypothetical protein BD410DRAFT_843823 [Rickenella mellea]
MTSARRITLSACDVLPLQDFITTACTNHSITIQFAPFTPHHANEATRIVIARAYLGKDVDTFAGAEMSARWVSALTTHPDILITSMASDGHCGGTWTSPFINDETGDVIRVPFIIELVRNDAKEDGDSVRYVEAQHGGLARELLASIQDGLHIHPFKT